MVRWLSGKGWALHLNYDCVYLHGHDSVNAAHEIIGSYMICSNQRTMPASLNRQ